MYCLFSKCFKLQQCLAKFFNFPLTRYASLRETTEFRPRKPKNPVYKFFKKFKFVTDFFRNSCRNTFSDSTENEKF